MSIFSKFIKPKPKVGGTMSIFTRAINAVKTLAQKIGNKANVLDIATYLLGQIPAIATNFMQFKGMEAKEKIDNFWEEFDARTGLEGPDIIKSLPPEIEEQLFDHVKGLGTVMCYWAAGLYNDADGNAIEPSAAEVKQAGEALKASLAHHD